VPLIRTETPGKGVPVSASWMFPETVCCAYAERLIKISSKLGKIFFMSSVG
jgi:hypothetical protein